MASHTYIESDIFILPPFSTASSAATATHEVTGPSPKATSNLTIPDTLGGVSENATEPDESSHPPQNRQCTRTEKEVKATYNGPFCEPNDLVRVHPGESWTASWDPTLYDDYTIVSILLEYTDSLDGADTEPFWHEDVPNSLGTVSIEMEREWLRGESRTNLSLSMAMVSGEIHSGPRIRLEEKQSPPESISATSTAEATTKHTSSSKLGMEVGIPVGLVFVAALGIGLFLGFRRRKQGYTSRRSRSQGMKNHGSVQYTGDDFRTTKSTRDSFKDEAVQGGVELQPRAGHRREDSIGGDLISPVSPISPVRTSNVFRDEISRQRAGL